MAFNDLPNLEPPRYSVERDGFVLSRLDDVVRAVRSDSL